MDNIWRNAKAPIQVEYLAPESLLPYSGNARIHSKKQLAQIGAAIREFGFINPVIARQDNTILAGHGRVEAAKTLGMPTVPVIRVEHLNDARMRAYIIADNRLAELAGWDKDILRIELQGLDARELDFDLEITGFDTAELDLFIDPAEPAKDDPEDSIPDIQEAVVTRPGDLWLCGDHKLCCGDAREEVSYRLLMGEEKARLAFSDPPYNVKIARNVSGLGKKKHTDFVMAAGEMDPAAFTEFLQIPMRHMAAYSVDGSIHFICMDWRHIGEVLAAGKAVYSELKNLAVWAKTNAGMGSFYRSQHEIVFVFKNGEAVHTNTFGLGEKGRFRSNLWTYPGCNTFGKGREEDLENHPTVKPTALVADAIKDVSRRGEIVLDPFAGSGTTMIAAEKTKRIARLIELDPTYCDVICRRFTKYTGKPAVLAATGQTFEQVKAERLAVAEA